MAGERMTGPADRDEAVVKAGPGDWCRLLSMVDAVLKLHVPVDRGRVMPCCRGCEEVNGGFHEDCCHEWPCPTFEAIAGLS